MFFDRGDAGVGVEPSVHSADCGAKTAQVHQGMKCSEFSHAQAARILVASEGKTDGIGDVDADPSAGLEFAIEDGKIGVRTGKKVAAEATEIAADRFPLLDGLDAVDRGRLALKKQPCRLQAPHLDHRIGRIVCDRNKVGSRPRRHALADRPAVENDHRLPCRRQLIGRRQPGNAGADHDGIGVLCAIEGRRIVRDLDVHPQRAAALVADVHDRRPRIVAQRGG
jgi:hypothetical protein